jgi:hypothetical protein
MNGPHRSIEYHLDRAQEHLQLLHNGDQQQDQLSHAAVRPAYGVDLA